MSYTSAIQMSIRANIRIQSNHPFYKEALPYFLDIMTYGKLTLEYDAYGNKKEESLIRVCGSFILMLVIVIAFLVFVIAIL